MDDADVADVVAPSDAAGPPVEPSVVAAPPSGHSASSSTHAQDLVGQPAAAASSRSSVLSVETTRTLELWRTGYNIGRHHLEDRRRALTLGTTVITDNLALIAVQRDGHVRVDYYHSVKSHAGKALRVTLEDLNRVKYSVTNSLGEQKVPMVEWLASGQATLVLRDCGVGMNKPFRLHMPDHALHIRKAWRRALGEAVDRGPCMCCGDDNRDDAGTLIHCPLCFNSMHSNCGTELLAQMRSAKFKFAKLPIDVLPKWIATQCCPMCCHASPS